MPNARVIHKIGLELAMRNRLLLLLKEMIFFDDVSNSEPAIKKLNAEMM